MTVDGYISADAVAGCVVCSPISFTDEGGELVAILDGQAVRQIERIHGMPVVPQSVAVYLPNVPAAVRERVRALGFVNVGTLRYSGKER